MSHMIKYMTKNLCGQNFKWAISEDPYKVQKINTNYLLVILLKCCQEKVSTHCGFCKMEV